MATAFEVAKYFLQLAAAEDEPECVSHLRLQKLCYYAQGWHLGIRGAPLFPERVEAWAHGPVVPEIYPRFADYGISSIPPERFADVDLTSGEMDFVASVWASYRDYSAHSLREMTHAESPWVNARKGIPPGGRCRNEITQDSMREFFSKSAA